MWSLIDGFFLERSDRRETEIRTFCRRKEHNDSAIEKDGKGFASELEELR